MSEIDLFEDPVTTKPPGVDLFAGADAGAPPTADVLETDPAAAPTDVLEPDLGTAPAPTVAAPPAIAPTTTTPREVQPEETMQGQFADLFAQDSPIMEIARQRQLRVENRRGLLNTAAGQRRGELSGIEAGLVIAGRDAATYARAAELNQSYEEAQNFAEQSFQHNWSLNNQLQQNASTLSYQDFTQGIQASIQTFKEQGALMLQKFTNNLDLSDQEQQELLELTTIRHENTIREIEAQGEAATRGALEQIAARGAIEMDQLIKGSELTIDELIAKGDIDIANVLTQMESQFGYDQSLAQLGQDFNIELSEVQNNLSILRDAQQSYLRREEMAVQLGNDLTILTEQTSAAIKLSDLDHLESLDLLTKGTAEDIRRMTVANGFTKEQQDNALENAKQEILARTDASVILSQLDSAEAQELVDKQADIEANLIDQRSDRTIIENNSQFANRLIEIQAQTQAQKELDRQTGARQLQTNYLIESGALLRQSMQDIAQINTTEGLTVQQQRSAVQQVRTRLQSDLDFMQEMYSSSPLWNPDWAFTIPESGESGGAGSTTATYGREGFDTQSYLDANPPLQTYMDANPSFDPYQHYLSFGQKEGRESGQENWSKEVP